MHMRSASMGSTRSVGTRCSILVVLASCILLPHQAAGYDGGPIKVCVPAQQSAAQLANCTTALGSANTSDVQFTCVAGGSVFGVGSLTIACIFEQTTFARVILRLQCMYTGIGMNATANLQKKLQTI